MWTRNSDVPDRNMLEHSIYPSPSKPATSPLCSAYYRYSSKLSSSFCILSFLVRATSIDQTFYSATHYLAAVWLDSRHGLDTVQSIFLHSWQSSKFFLLQIWWSFKHIIKHSIADSIDVLFHFRNCLSDVWIKSVAKVILNSLWTMYLIFFKTSECKENL